MLAATSTPTTAPASPAIVQGARVIYRTREGVYGAGEVVDVKRGRVCIYRPGMAHAFAPISRVTVCINA